MSEKIKRCTPEEALEKIKKETRGHLKIFLGYAPGVGKTYCMLNEANRRYTRGQDIVIGLVETHNREETINQINNLEIIPPKKIFFNNTEFNEVDVDAIIKRHPTIVIIDELSHTNAIGSKNKKRYEDIEILLNSGISVITTLNIQHIESLNIVIRKITGIKITETIPDYILDNAHAVVLVDISTDELHRRLEQGIIYKDNNENLLTKNFFRKNNLSALRELSLRLTAEGVDEHLEEYMRQHGIHDNWHTVERVMVCITPNLNGKKLIRKGAKISSKFKCEWFVVSVSSSRIFSSNIIHKDIEALNNHYKLAKQLGAEVVSLNGKNISKTLANFASQKYITQIVIGTSRKTKLQYFFTGSPVTQLIKYTKNIELHIVPSD